MPVCTVHLLSLTPATPLPSFLRTLSLTSLNPLTVARVVRWVILPSQISTAPLLARNIHWDLLLIVPSTSPLPAELQKLVAHQWSVQAGVPTKIVQGFGKRNETLLNPQKGDVPELILEPRSGRVAESSQGLELSEELRQWVESFGQQEGKGAVSMLNLLAFKPGLKGEYLKYGAEFARSIGSKRGGNAKIVGSVIHGNEGGEDGNGWDEIALAHYPSVHHFANMLASEDYQAVNQRYRVGSLKDTFILCTSEIGIGEIMSSSSKL